MLGISRRGHLGKLLRVLVITAVAGLIVTLGERSVNAQAVYGSISGTIKDNTGGVLPGVTVKVTSIERQTADEVVSNESGFYMKDRLLPGIYEVRAELAGFKQPIFANVTVNVDTNTTLNMTMSLGEVSEQVTVLGVSPLLRT